MSQQENSEILGEEWIAPSLLEPEYPGLMLPVDSIDSEDLIFQEDSIFPAYSIDSEDSIASQEIDVDPLTGMARNSLVNAVFNGSQVTALKDATLDVNRTSMWFSNWMRVTATVKVELSSSQMDSINNGGPLVLQSTVWGIDNTFYDRTNDNLFSFPDQNITSSGTYTFSKVVASSVLNEDRWWFDRRDEIAASISLISYSSTSPLNLKTMTNMGTGFF